LKDVCSRLVDLSKIITKSSNRKSSENHQAKIVKYFVFFLKSIRKSKIVDDF